MPPRVHPRNSPRATSLPQILPGLDCGGGSIRLSLRLHAINLIVTCCRTRGGSLWVLLMILDRRPNPPPTPPECRSWPAHSSAFGPLEARTRGLELITQSGGLTPIMGDSFIRGHPGKFFAHPVSSAPAQSDIPSHLDWPDFTS